MDISTSLNFAVNALQQCNESVERIKRKLGKLKKKEKKHMGEERKLFCGMKVLARNGSGRTWYPSLYGYSRKNETGETIYICTNGMAFTECIPLWGNEDLAGTQMDIGSVPDPDKFFHEQLVAVKNLEDDDWIPAIFDHVSTIPASKPYHAKLTEHSPVKAYAFCEPAVDVFTI